MHRFGEIADELTDLIEELELPTYRDDARVLIKDLQRAFHSACLADRAVRESKAAAAVRAKTVRRRAA